MPSPTWTTEPTSRVSTAVEKFLICSTRMELISSVGAAMCTSACQGTPQTLEASANAVVNQSVTNARHDAADNARVDVRAHLYFVRVAVQMRGQALGHEPLHLAIERYGGCGVVGG